MTRRIVAARRDGLGGRLGALLNAVRLADALGWEFGFLWPEVGHTAPEHQALGPPELFFEPAFIERHLARNYNRKRFHAVRGTRLRRANVDAIAADASRDGFSIFTYRGPIRGDWEGKAPAPDLGTIFAAIPFVEPLQAVMRRVQAKVAPDAACLHVRRGDFIFTETRRAWFPEKVVPLGILHHVLSVLSAEGRQVIIVGDDREMNAQLARLHGTRTADDLLDGELGKIERAFFDLKLMASCADVIGSSSAFSLVATLIGGARHRSAWSFLAPDEIEAVAVAHLRANAAEYSPLERAKTCEIIARQSPALTAAQRAAYFAEAHAADPDNESHGLSLAIELANQGLDAEAEAVLRETAERLFGASGGRQIDFLRLRTMTSAAPDRLDPIAAAAGRGAFPYLSAYHGYLAGLAGDGEAARQATARAAALAPESAVIAIRQARAEIDEGAGDAARRRLDAVVARRGRFAAAHTLLADIEWTAGEGAAAFEQAIRAHRCAREDGVGRARAALFAERAGESRKARKWGRRAVEVGPFDPGVHHWLSVWNEEKGDLRRALRHARAAQELRPNSVRLRHRVKALRALRRAERARAAAGDGSPTPATGGASGT